MLHGPKLMVLGLMRADWQSLPALCQLRMGSAGAGPFLPSLEANTNTEPVRLVW